MQCGVCTAQPGATVMKKVISPSSLGFKPSNIDINPSKLQVRFVLWKYLEYREYLQVQVVLPCGSVISIWDSIFLQNTQNMSAISGQSCK